MAVTLSDRVTIRIGPGSLTAAEKAAQMDENIDKIGKALGKDNLGLDDFIRANGGDPTNMTDDEKVQFALDHGYDPNDFVTDEDGNVSAPWDRVKDLVTNGKIADNKSFEHTINGKNVKVGAGPVIVWRTVKGKPLGMIIDCDYSVIGYYNQNLGNYYVMFANINHGQPSASPYGDDALYATIRLTNLDDIIYWGSPGDVTSSDHGVYGMSNGTFQDILGGILNESDVGIQGQNGWNNFWRSFAADISDYTPLSELSEDELEDVLSENGAETYEEATNEQRTIYDETFNYEYGYYVYDTSGQWLRYDLGTGGYLLATEEASEALSSLYPPSHFTSSSPTKDIDVTLSTTYVRLPDD